MKQIIKMIALSIAGVASLLLIVGTLFLNLNPRFGKSPSSEQEMLYANSKNFRKGKFRNEHASPMDLDFWKLLKEYAKKAPNRNPGKNIRVEKIDVQEIENLRDSITRLTWFGHSAFLLEMDGKKILIDPMLGNVPAPHPLLGPKRYSKELPIEIEQLPFIDAVILSHDHYDHLDYESIIGLKNKVGRFFTPLGVGSHLVSWGIAEGQITELDWWESTVFDDITLVCTPARHFSGRGMFDRAKTLWGSWVIKGTKDNVFFSGDSGYDTHFKEIGERFGPFDLSLMECGQYHVDWKYLHMMPEETVQASIDLRSKLTIPIHWGAFTLALHDWTDPAHRMLKKARELDMPVATPKIGQQIIIGDDAIPKEHWWLEYMKKNVR